MAEGRNIYTVKAFTSDPDEGSAAAVVPDAAGLTDEQMLAVARAMGFSETAFMLPTELAGVEFRLRWFTPTIEVSLCGHATVATLKVLAQEGRLPTDGSHRTIETLSGTLRVAVEKDENRQIHRLQLPVPEFREMEIPEDKAKVLLGLYPSDRLTVWPAVTHGDVPFVPLISIGNLKKLRPDFRRMKDDPVFSCVCFFTSETLKLGNTWHCRFFAPGYGINEDPVTGAINGPLGAYWYQYVDPFKPPRAEYVGEQGDIIGCPGRVFVTVEGDGARPTNVEIGGEAVITAKESLNDVLQRIT